MPNGQVRVKCEDGRDCGAKDSRELCCICAEGRPQSSSSIAFRINCQPSPMPSQQPADKALVVMEVQHGCDVRSACLQIIYRSWPSHSFRYSVGLVPQIWRNIRAKCCCVLKPQATATSNTRASEARNRSLARSTQCRRTN